MNDLNQQNELDELINSSIQNIKELSQANTIVGDPIISPSGSIIIPISKVSVGYIAGGGQYNSVNKKLPYPLAGGSGGGVSVTPIGFIVETDTEIKFIDVENKTAYQTILNLANTLLSKINNNMREKEDEK